MPIWTCPNTECKYDKNLKSGQHCPLCGKKAQAFDFNDLGNLLKEKWKYKKSLEKAKSDEAVSRLIKFCPRCGSPNMNVLVFYRPSIWKCLDCGYEGTFVVQDGELASKIREKHQKTLQEK